MCKRGRGVDLNLFNDGGGTFSLKIPVAKIDLHFEIYCNFPPRISSPTPQPPLLLLKDTSCHEIQAKSNMMTEVEVNGSNGVDLDITATKASLSSSSTSLRLESLHTLEERLSNNGTRP
jgi:hypothetical protein